MHSYLIATGDRGEIDKRTISIAVELLELRSRKLDGNPDILVVTNEDKPSIGIEKVREIITWVSLKPFQSKAKLVVIQNAQLLTTDAQNALLKTLEEPPKNSYFILTTTNKKLLLPTVISRCALVSTDSKTTTSPDRAALEKESVELQNLVKKSLGARLDYVEENKEIFGHKDETLKKLDLWITILRKLLLETEIDGRQKNNYTGLYPEAINRLLAARAEITATNVNPRNLVEVFLLKLPVP